MADKGSGLDSFAHSAHSLAEDMHKSQKSSEGVSGSLLRSLVTLKGIDQLWHSVVTSIEKTKTGTLLKEAFSVSSGTLVMKKAQIEADIKQLKNSTTAEERRRKWHKELFDMSRADLAQVNAQLNVAKLLENGGRTRLALAGALLAAASNLGWKQRQFNQDLIEANSTYAHRNELLDRTLITQAQLGVSFEKAKEAARALVHYGLDTEKTYNANVKLVVQMEQGLGVSVNASAHLATIVERQLKGSFRDVADIVSEIVENTALAGEEATKLATSISTAMGRLKPGLSAAGLPEVLKLVGRYEGALKEIGGQSGGFEQLLTGLTRPEGIVGMGALGVNPDFISTADGVQKVMDRFAKYGNMLVGQSQGLERQFRLQILAEQFNVSTDQANQMLMAITRANAAQGEAISIQDRWKNQIHATNQGIDRLTNTLLGLLHKALLPLVNFISGAINKVADVVETLLENENVITGIVITSGVAFVALVGSLSSLTTALWQTVTGANFASVSLARFNAIRLGQRLTRGANALSLTGPMVGVPMLAGLAVIAGGVAGLGYLLNEILTVEKKSLDEQQKDNLVNINKYATLQDNTESKIYDLARYGGSQSDIEKQIGLLMQRIKVEYAGDRAVLKEKLAEAQAQVAADLNKAIVTRVIAGELVDKNEIKDEENELVDITKKMHILAENALRVDMKRLQNQKDEADEALKQTSKFWSIPYFNLPGAAGGELTKEYINRSRGWR